MLEFIVFYGFLSPRLLLALLSNHSMDIFEKSFNGSENVKGSTEIGVDTKVERFKLCPKNMSEYIPFLDNVAATSKLKSMVRGERFECLYPDKANRLNCLVPTPPKYSAPIPWPRSRDEVCCNLSPLFF